jgi:hypothetical protein
MQTGKQQTGIVYVARLSNKCKRPGNLHDLYLSEEWQFATTKNVFYLRGELCQYAQMLVESCVDCVCGANDRCSYTRY